jgi:excisionase family DNA binding protein
LEVEMERFLYTVEEVAQMLGLGRTKVYELIKLGEIPSVRISRARRVSGDAVTAFIARLTSPATGAAVHMFPAATPEPSVSGTTMATEPDVEEAS